MFGLAAGKRDTGERLGNPVSRTEARATVIDSALAAAALTSSWFIAEVEADGRRPCGR
jgi:hypothetical protein